MVFIIHAKKHNLRIKILMALTKTLGSFTYLINIMKMKVHQSTKKPF